MKPSGLSVGSNMDYPHLEEREKSKDPLSGANKGAASTASQECCEIDSAGVRRGERRQRFRAHRWEERGVSRAEWSPCGE